MSFIFKDKFWYYTINTVLSILIFFPVLIILILSFKTTTEIRFENFLSTFTLNNFFSIWDLEIRTNKNTFKQSFFNSGIVTLGTIVLSLIVSTLAGYSLTFFRIPFKEAIFIALILPILIPAVSLIIPIYKLLKSLG